MILAPRVNHSWIKHDLDDLRVKWTVAFNGAQGACDETIFWLVAFSFAVLNSRRDFPASDANALHAI